MLRLSFPSHARKRMAQRGITEEHVRRAFESPISVVPGKSGAMKVIARIHNRRICVVYQELARAERRIVSTWWIEYDA